MIKLQKPALLSDEQTDRLKAMCPAPIRGNYRKPSNEVEINPAARMKRGKDFEDKVMTEYEENGWTVIRNGWPDMLCVNESGNMEAHFVECKAGSGNLHHNQRKMINMLKRLGLTVIVRSE